MIHFIIFENEGKESKPSRDKIPVFTQLWNEPFIYSETHIKEKSIICKHIIFWLGLSCSVLEQGTNFYI